MMYHIVMKPLPPISRLISLSGQRALVSGAGSGIGRAIALRLAEAGAELELVDRDPVGLERVGQELAGWPSSTGLRWRK